MKKRLLRIQELSLVMLEHEREELGRDAPVHVVRALPTLGGVTDPACGKTGLMQLFLPFLWFLGKNPNACKTCMEICVKDIDPRDLL